MANHDIKSTPEHFAEVRAGRKTFELRLNDRNYAMGDLLTIREFQPRGAKYTGEVEMRRVTHVLTGQSVMGGSVLSPQYVILSLGLIQHPNGETVAPSTNAKATNPPPQAPVLPAANGAQANVAQNRGAPPTEEPASSEVTSVVRALVDEAT